MKQLIVKAERSAWGTIRGYVYQVDLTIQRWLKLRPNSALELERGEDVDTVFGAMRQGVEKARLLEQIKARDQKLTLRSAEALTALAYFYEHERKNPSFNLSYRYITNARVAKERRSPIADGTPLITVWNNLRDKRTGLAGPLLLIRNFLQTTTMPRDLPETTWKPFVKFVKDSKDKSFSSFVKKVEWLTHQTPTDLVAQEIKRTLVSEYEIPSDQAHTVYSALFLHVFKLLTQSGIKRLTTDDRDNILADPRVDPADRALHTNLEFYISQLTERVEKLEEAVSVLQPRSLPTASEIQEACHKATRRLAAGIIGGRKIIDRENLRERVNEFLSSEARYLVVLGPSGVGKSISAASEAEQMIEGGATVLLVQGKYFSLEQASQLITQEIWPPPTELSWEKVVEIMAEDQAADKSELVLVIEAIDEADDLHELSLQLTKLQDSLGATSPKKVKVILVCRDTAWGRFSQLRLMPLYGSISTISQLADFTTSELNRALQQIDATELINPGRFGETASAHIATFREMLKHPATFDHYATLRQTNDEISIQDITWTYLVRERLARALEKAARECHQGADDLRTSLERIATLSWQTGSKNFELSMDELNLAVPCLTKYDVDGSPSPLVALIANSVLVESHVTSQRRVAFQTSDLGAYLLSFELERQTKSKRPGEVLEFLKEWLDKSWDFPPLLDAILALLDRFIDQPHSSASLAMVKVLVESNRFHNSSIFELMRPEVLKTIFEIIKGGDANSFYDYRDAALGIRPSPAALEEIRSHLKDENEFARQLAAELTGAHQDEVAIEELIQLLRDPDESVQDKTFKAFGHIGAPAVVPLLKIIDDRSRSIELRSSCITALRNVGLRTAGVSAALTRSLKESSLSTEMLNSSLLSAAGLRDRGHADTAKKALRHENERIVLAAGKYLTEVPEPKAFNALRDFLKPQASTSLEPHNRSWTLNQVIKALWDTDKVKAAPILLKIIKNALKDCGELMHFRAIHLAEKIDLAAIPPLIFKQLIKQLGEGEEGRLAWESAKVLGATWRTDHLDALTEENRSLSGQGIDTAKLFVDAIIPGIQLSEEFPLGDRLNRISDLPTLVKCQAENFATEAARLFDYSGVLSCMKLSDLLWVCGDTRVEEALIHRMENPSEKLEGRHERAALIRALGTCGKSSEAATVVFDYMRNERDNISYEFEQEILYPLLTRNVISDTQLIEIGRDSTVPWASRSASLQALGLINAQNYKETFAEVAKDSADQPRLQSDAVFMLGLTHHKSAIPQLRQFLSDSQHVAIKAAAAEALARLDDGSSIHDIERALEDSHALGYVFALSHFRRETSLPLLIDRLSTISSEYTPGYLRALGAFWKYPKGKVAILDQFDGWSDPDERYLNNQAELITGLVDHEPDVILDQFNKAFDDGYVTSNARVTMAKKLADLFYRKHPNEQLLLETARRLLSDRHVPAREKASHALGFAKASFCIRVYREMYDTSGANEWEKASAVYSLGFWESPMSLIKAARYHEELLVRRTADAALDIRLKKRHLEWHFEQYNRKSGLARLSSYLCLAEQGDQSTIWDLNDNNKTSPSARTFRRPLIERIKKRLGDEYKKKLEEEKVLPDSRGSITFD